MADLTIPDDIQPDLSELTDYAKWEGRIDLDDYALYNLTADLAIATTRIFVPEFVEYRGGIFFKSMIKDIIDDWIARLNGDMKSVEQVYNHRHMGDLLMNVGDLNYENLAYFGSILRLTWKAALQQAFPDRKFIVTAEKQDEDWGDVIVTFWQEVEA